MNDVQYAGFWIRAAATIIDTILLLIVLMPIAFLFVDTDAMMAGGGGTMAIILNYVAPALVVILFWVYKSATPGKMVLKLRIVDADSGEQPSTAQFVGRYFSYYLSTIPLMLGFIWVAFDQRKQGWHDKLAGTVVIKES
ncbi:MAG: RDD family protein [Pseudomonadales bacterium]